MTTVRTPKLKRISLRYAEKHEHPHLKTDGTMYLVQQRGHLDVGTFSRQHYGLNFTGFYPAGLQFDAPGYNHSNWEAIWEIVR